MADEERASGTKRPGRNEPCHCGSGKKYKHCCLEKDEELDRAARLKAAEEAAAHAEAEEHPEHAEHAEHAARPPKRPPDQPWKAGVRRPGGFHKVSGPRKIGSS